MIDHLLAVYPHEGCGFLAGRAGRATQVYPVANTLRSPAAFRMDPRQQIAALMAIDAAQESLLAIFHSHPGGSALLSAADLAEATFFEPAAVVVALEGAPPQVAQVRAFHLSAAAAGSPLYEIPLIIV